MIHRTRPRLLGWRAGGPLSGLSSAARLDEATSSVLAGRGLRVADYYGIAETGPLTFNSAPEPGGGQGHPLPGVTLRVDEAGVLLARSSSMGSRYLNYPGQLEARIDDNGFYRTTDQGFLTDDGGLCLTGRVGTTLEVGGRKFLGDEIVRLLDSHERVAGSAVAMVETGSGNPVLGAVVVPLGDIDAIELRRYLLSRIAAYKVPEVFVFVDRLPVTGAGKTQMTAVRDMLVDGVRGRDSIVD
jgi:acyl-coenzyme A synthetase/AMP-(fatty) acid ligase